MWPKKSIWEERGCWTTIYPRPTKDLKHACCLVRWPDGPPLNCPDIAGGMWVSKPFGRKCGLQRWPRDALSSWKSVCRLTGSCSSPLTPSPRSAYSIPAMVPNRLSRGAGAVRYRKWAQCESSPYLWNSKELVPFPAPPKKRKLRAALRVCASDETGFAQVPRPGQYRKQSVPAVEGIHAVSTSGDWLRRQQCQRCVWTQCFSTNTLVYK